MIYFFCGTRRLTPAKNQIERWLKYAPGPMFLVVGLDLDIFEGIQEFINELSESEQERVTLIFEPYSQSFSYAVNAGWGRVRAENPGENILAMAGPDDQEFYPNWHEAALEYYHKSFPDLDGLLFLNDLRASDVSNANYGKSGLCLISAKFCDKYMGGWLVSPYHHVSGIDIEYAFVSMLHGKHAFCAEAKCRHLMLEWQHRVNSESRLLGVQLMYDRIKRNCIYDIEAPWRYWE